MLSVAQGPQRHILSSAMDTVTTKKRKIRDDNVVNDETSTSIATKQAKLSKRASNEDDAESIDNESGEDLNIDSPPDGQTAFENGAQDSVTPTNPKTFDELSLSEKTMKAINAMNFKDMTEIQSRVCIIPG